MAKNSTFVNRIWRQPAWRWGVAIGIVVLAVVWLKSGAKPKDVGTTFVARRGPLDITVLDGGSIESEEKGEVKCEVKGGQGVKILKIVEEGYPVSEQDVKTNKVLVELDSADLRSKIIQQEITFGSTRRLADRCSAGLRHPIEPEPERRQSGRAKGHLCPHGF
jgi:multidrug efflux pump subunit AcrA (membrane-fusion protein)